jgi:limonene-1,2-epoxide hydrolase
MRNRRDRDRRRGDSMSDPIDLVRRFCDTWPTGDVDALMAFFADDAVYHNIPMEPANGVDAIRATIQGFATGSEIEFRILHIAAAGNVVLTERVDVFRIGEKNVELPVSGTFEIADGRITAWRDYFDLQQLLSQMSS